MIQLKLFEDDFKVGDEVWIKTKSLGMSSKPHRPKDVIDEIFKYPDGYDSGTRDRFPDRIPKIGEMYYHINGYYYLTKDLKKVV